MPVLDDIVVRRRPLADLHEYAGKLGVDRYRLLRRDELISVLLERSGQPNGAGPEAPAPAPKQAPRQVFVEQAPAPVAPAPVAGWLPVWRRSWKRMGFVPTRAQRRRNRCAALTSRP